jgi:hypothetical protein
MFPAIFGTTELSVLYAIPERGELLPIAPVTSSRDAGDRYLPGGRSDLPDGLDLV